MSFTYLEAGSRASDIVPGALVQGIHEVGEIGKKSDVYVITEVKRTEKKREAVASLFFVLTIISAPFPNPSGSPQQRGWCWGWWPSAG